LLVSVAVFFGHTTVLYCTTKGHLILVCLRTQHRFFFTSVAAYPSLFNLLVLYIDLIGTSYHIILLLYYRGFRFIHYRIFIVRRKQTSTSTTIATTITTVATITTIKTTNNSSTALHCTALIPSFPFYLCLCSSFTSSLDLIICCSVPYRTVPYRIIDFDFDFDSTFIKFSFFFHSNTKSFNATQK
jgi:hypothetical protein